jgi:ribonuclease BN (tRNA processing enzyme)
MLPSDDATRLVCDAFEVYELHDGHDAQNGDMQLRSLAVEHGIPSFGLRVEHDRQVLAYSGDTGPCPALIELARDADLLVCEAGAAEPQPTHCTPSEAGQAAANARSRRLMLTHLAHAIDETRAIADATHAAGYQVEAARPRTRTILGADRP